MSRILLVAVAIAVLLAAGIAFAVREGTSHLSGKPAETAPTALASAQPMPSATPVSGSPPSPSPAGATDSDTGTQVASLPPPAPPHSQPICAGTPTLTAASFSSADPDASYCAAGHLVPGSGTGATETTDWAPDMRFPIDRAPAFANSQVWGVGGTSGSHGGQSDPRNYSYPWHDDFCEARGYATVMCPTGRGHQGQDIRPAACCDAAGHLLQDTFVVDAVEDGQITSIGTYTVYLTGESGRLYRYLHMDMKHLMVHDGDRVTRGQHIGYVSNYFGNSVTTFHLHFEIKAPVSADGRTVYTWVSPYPSLVTSYAKLLGGNP
jgi:murein DD-endopeptidase MepM/ murein hydrolase activator NlpD